MTYLLTIDYLYHSYPKLDPNNTSHLNQSDTLMDQKDDALYNHTWEEKRKNIYIHIYKYLYINICQGRVVSVCNYRGVGEHFAKG